MLKEQPYPEKKKKIHAKGHWNRRTPDYHINSLAQDTLLDLQNGGLDDIQSFNCDMYNFGDMENLPESDRNMISSNESCKEYRF